MIEPIQKNLVLAVASGKGGTGKTMVSTNLAFALRNQRYAVTLVDCDAEEPNDLLFFPGSEIKSFNVVQKVPVIDESKCTYCGKCHEYCNYHAIFFLGKERIIEVMEDLCHGCGACSVACQFDAITEKEMTLGTVGRYVSKEGITVIEARMKVGVYSPVSVIKAAIKESHSAGVVILDSPPGTSCSFIQTVSVADYVLLVTEPTPFGLSDLKQSVDTLRTLQKPCGVLINRADLGNDEIYEYLHDERIPLLMEIPFNRKIAELYSSGCLLAEKEGEWENKFFSLISNIVAAYGNSDYKR